MSWFASRTTCLYGHGAMAALVVESGGQGHHAGMMEAVPALTALTATLADGRLISWAEYGSPHGAPLVMLHGTPGSRLQ
jgi:hypothetical protein